MLATLHLPPEWYPPSIFSDARVYLHCVSDAQHRRCPPAEKLLPPITNGVDLRILHPERRKHDYVLALGRVCPERAFTTRSMRPGRPANASS